MATRSTTSRCCVKCPKGQGQVMCGGCEQWFCHKHLADHRDELARQMDDLTVEHDQLQHDLIVDGDDRRHPLFTRVDRWESDAIERINQVANEVRDQLRDLLGRSKRHVEDSLRTITDELQENRRMENHTEIDLTRWMTRLRELREQLDRPSTMEMENEHVQATSVDISMIKLSAKRDTDSPHVLPQITDTTKWSVNGRTVTGGHGQGDASNQLHSPHGLDIDDDGSLFIADTSNHRIVRGRPNTRQSEIMAGGKGAGKRIDQLYEPVVVLLDRINRILIISESRNRRVVQCSIGQQWQNDGENEVIISNVESSGLAMDEDGSLYVSDWEKHEVRQYGRGEGRGGIIVAGGNGLGSALNQLHCPENIFVDADHSVYVADSENHRIMKWLRNVKEGVIVAGGRGQGKSLAQLSDPSGIFVDRMGSVYVADQGNHRVMRWMKDAKKGEVLMGGNGRGRQSAQFNRPAGVSLDKQGNLYVVDRGNHRIQRFDLQ